MSQAVFGRAARREHAWPSGRLGRGGATIAQPPRRDALVLNEDDHLLPEGCGLLDRGGVHAAPLQMEGDCPSIELYPLPCTAATLSSVRRLRGVKDKMESRDSSSWPVSFLLLVVQAMRLLQSESIVFWQQERGQAGRGLCLLCPYSPPSHNSFQWTGHSSTHHPTALKPKCTP